MRRLVRFVRNPFSDAVMRRRGAQSLVFGLCFPGAGSSVGKAGQTVVHEKARACGSGPFQQFSANLIATQI
jgi:hypothetical protein